MPTLPPPGADRWAPVDFWRLAHPGERIALVDETGRSHRYDSLAADADAAAQGLVAGRVFALGCANTLATVRVLLGALRARAVPVLLDAEMDPARRDELLAHHRIGLWVDGRDGSRTGHAAAGPMAHPALGLLLSTSGSTGSPKLVRLSHTNLAANAGSIAAYLGLGPDEVAVTTLPLHYSYGLSVLNSHLAAGARVVLTAHTITQAPFWSLLKAQGVTSLSGVPTWWRMLRRLRFERMDLPSLHTLTQAGGRLEPDEVLWLHDAARRHGRTAYVMYGQTEATARIAYLPPDWLPAKAGAIGVAIPGGQLRVLDADGQPLTSPDAVGEIAYRGPNVMMGYALQPEDLAAPPDTPELRTGDLGRIDADGCCWVTGRLKRFIKLAGHRVSLDELEQSLRAAGHEAAVVGRDDRLQVALAGADEAAAQGLATELARRHRWLPASVQVRAVDALPLASNGKLQYAVLQQQLDAADHPDAVAAHD